jgi:hypothetical protein
MLPIDLNIPIFIDETTFQETLDEIDNIDNQTKATDTYWVLHRHHDGRTFLNATSVFWLFFWADTKGGEQAKEVFKNITGVFYQDFYSALERIEPGFKTNGTKNNKVRSRLKRSGATSENTLRSISGQTVTAEKLLQDDLAYALARHQGYLLDSEIKKNIEIYAMEKATAYFKDLGYKVEDRSKHKSYDLFCTKGTETLFIEVKGTQSQGEQIILTRNEAELAQDHKGSMSLFVFHNIVVDKKTKAVSEGEMTILNPWNISDGKLVPISYYYSI